EALALIVTRGQIMQALPQGSMLAVSLAEAEIAPFLGELVCLAAVNGPSRCVVSGPSDALAELEQALTRRGESCHLLHTSHAFHSSMMEPILEQFTLQMKRVQLRPPHIPYISNLSGTWITAAEATNPLYWTKHLRQTVRFADGLGELLQENGRIFLEVGPGNTLSTFVKQQPAGGTARSVLLSLQRSQQGRAEMELIVSTAGQLWLAGVPLNWEQFHAHERCRRIPLPAYPFERKQYWIEDAGAPGPQAAQGAPGPGAQEFLTQDGVLTRAEVPKEEAMQIPAPRSNTPPQAQRLPQIRKQLISIFSHALGIQPDEIDPEVTFFELGADSLALLQVSQTIQD